MANDQPTDRRLPIGAEPIGDGVHFRVWSPGKRAVAVVIEAEGGQPAEHLLTAEEDEGYFSTTVDGCRPGARYRFRLDGGQRLLSDPASRFQPEGPLGPSQVVDPAAFAWNDAEWQGLAARGQVLYEMHIGTFTAAGTWAAAAERLPQLADIGVTALEVMPVADFAGRFGWGYDGVNLFAPSRLYGTPDEMRGFVDAAHRLGIGVILDIVLHRLGAVGNFLPEFSSQYLTDRYPNEWGPAVNFDGPGCRHVREYVLGNARYWIDEFHLDGYRVDATQAFFDASPRHILAEVATAARSAAGGRSLYIVAESEPQQARLLRPPEKGFGMDAAWNDDFHHAAMVRATGHNEAYYRDYRGDPEEFIATARWGYLYQGQWYAWQGKPRGTCALDLPAWAFVNYLQNHDQLANSARGTRLHQLTSPAMNRAMTAVLLLLPNTPMLFQGQEFAASSPFLYFADNEATLAAQVSMGRAEFLAQFPTMAGAEMRPVLCDPADPRTFARCKLDWAEREGNAAAVALHRDLVRLRQGDPVLSRQDKRRLEGASLGRDGFLLRYFGDDAEQGDRLLLVNFGSDCLLSPLGQPLVAPPEGKEWYLAWSSEDPKYGGEGTPCRDFKQTWGLRAQSTVVLASRTAVAQLG